MANPEHVEILMQGVRVWNKWRGDNVQVMPDLSGAILRGVDLSGADLSLGDLGGADLSWANMERVNLVRANLKGAIIHDAELSEAVVFWANFDNTHFGSDTVEAAPDPKVGVWGAKLSGTRFSENDLSTATGLDLVVFDSPACLDRETIVNSKGRLPESFIKGASPPGMVEEFLRLAKHLMSHGTDPERTVIREIEFEPQYKQAGMGILNYFGEILSQKYPDMDVKVNIRQEGLKVRMEIETPEGQKELVEETLEEYGLVVTGLKPPETLLENDHDILQLQFKLESTRSENRSMAHLLGHVENEKAQLVEMNQRLMKMVESGFDRADEARRDVKDIAEQGYKLQEGENMSAFDQRGQQVNYQYNAAGNIYIGQVQSRDDLVVELEKLQEELGVAHKAGVIDEDTTTDVEYQIKKAVQQAKKPDADKNNILGFLNKGKALIEGVKSASGLVQALNQAVDKVSELF